MSEFSKEDIDKTRANFKKTLLERDGELCYTIRTLASIMETPLNVALAVCEELIGDEEIKKKGYTTSIEDGFFMMKLVNKIERPDAPPVMTPVRDHLEACQRQATFLGFSPQKKKRI